MTAFIPKTLNRQQPICRSKRSGQNWPVSTSRSEKTHGLSPPLNPRFEVLPEAEL